MSLIMSPKVLKSKVKSWDKGGFTIAELMVTVAIFLIITTIVISNLPKLNVRISTDLLAHDIALTIRQAQVYSLSVRQGQAVGSFPGYGVHFDISSSNPSGTKEFLLFADFDSDGLYTPGEGCGQATTECLNKSTIQTANIIESLCGFSGGAGTCNPAVAPDGLSMLDVVFKRPEPNAIASGTDISGVLHTTYPQTPYASSEIVVTSPDGLTKKKVIVYETGQIAVVNLP